MKIDLRVDRGALRRWHLDLAARIARRPGARVGFTFADAPRAKAVDAALRFETLTLPEPLGAAARVSETAVAAGGGAYLTLDLAREGSPSATVWRVECDGADLESGLLAAACDRRAPTLRVLGPTGPIATARPGVERGHAVVAAFEDLLARAATLIEAALDGAAASPPPALPGAAPAAVPLTPGRLAKRVASGVRSRAVRSVYAKMFNAPHWRVGCAAGAGALGADGLAAGWTDLPDDGTRFYADPFPIVADGRTYLFVEDFAHELQRGVISVVEFGSEGPLGTPRLALETPTHLSYPYVFERDGAFWMIPESGGAGTIDLYRAHAFPFDWRHEATLVEGCVANDATLVERGGRWWMFATVRDGGGAFSDALHLWSAPDFRGPWTPHKRNPVLIDIASARPAGRMFSADGALWRPVQDCRAGYGAALALARVDRLDDEGFSQTVTAIYRSGAAWPGRRLHTYNEAGGLEFIDGSGWAPRWRALRKPLELARRREPRLAPA